MLTEGPAGAIFRVMSKQITMALAAKRAALAIEVQALQSAIYHLDAALALMGHTGKPLATKPRAANRFANGELMALVGDAQRAGCVTSREIRDHVMKAKGFDMTDRVLAAKIMMSVKDCRKRLKALS